jgi:hypothetical protein
MRRAVNAIFAVVCGIVGGWLGYWLGHWAGWSDSKADWPAHIGGGTGAIILSIVVAILGVAVAAAVMSLPTYRKTSKLLRDGTSAQAKVLETKRAGLTIRNFRGAREKVCCTLEVQPTGGSPFQTQACQFMPLALEAALKPDAVMKVRYDPKKPGRAAIEGPA